MPEVNIPQLLADADRACVVAAAGCGKTEAIARAVGLGQGRQLVLTHTHAGVWALRERLNRLGIPRDRYNVETIAGWSLRYCQSYPELSGVGPNFTPDGDAWALAYKGACEALKARAIRKVLERSYRGVFVDEYQDCTLEHHAVIQSLGESLPVRIVGDPLQGIFDFEGDLVDWERDVFPEFTRLPDLETPWRWASSNPQLGQWLQEVRPLLERGTPIGIGEDAPVQWIKKTPQTQHRACLDQLRYGGDSVVAIRKWAPACHYHAQRLGGAYSSMEEMDCRDLMTYAQRLSATRGVERALAVVDLAKECLSRIGPTISSLRTTLGRGKRPEIRANCPAPEVYKQAQLVVDEDNPKFVLQLMDALARREGVHGFRRELWYEMRRTLVAFDPADDKSLPGVAWTVRNATRQAGRRQERKTISRTLLIKGLEFDRAIVLDADELDSKNLYVAITRPKTGLVVLSDEREHIGNARV